MDLEYFKFVVKFDKLTKDIILNLEFHTVCRNPLKSEIKLSMKTFKG